METYDIVIIGGGVAGSIFAQFISDKYKVLLITKNDFVKPCGGLLSPRAQKELGRLNITLPKDILVDPQIFTVKTVDCSLKQVNHYQRHYINMDRFKFDQWLLKNISNHVKIETGLCNKIDQGNVIHYVVDGKEKQVKCRYLIGADGSNSLVRSTFFPKRKTPQYLAIQQWFTGKTANPYYSCIFDEQISDACSWSITKDNYFIFGGAYPISNARNHFEAQKEVLLKRGFKFDEMIKTEACLVSRPKSLKDICDGNKSIFLLGEAAGYISPSSFEGISYAITTAIKLASSFNQREKDIAETYDRKLISVKLSLLLKMIKTKILYTPVIRKIIIKSRIKNLKMIEKEYFKKELHINQL